MTDYPDQIIIDAEVAALVELTRYGVATDIQGLLCQGDERGAVPPFALRAAIRAAFEIAKLEAAQGWQPIETAPRDGAIFLAYQKRDENQVYECWWQDDFSHWSGWQDWWDNEPEPTHWMPLPKAPE